MRLETALDRVKVSESRYHAPGLVSRIMTRSEGLCSGGLLATLAVSRVDSVSRFARRRLYMESLGHFSKGCCTWYRWDGFVANH